MYPSRNAEQLQHSSVFQKGIRYSAAGMCPHNTQAASHICFSNPMLAFVFSAIIDLPSYFHAFICNFLATFI